MSVKSEVAQTAERAAELETGLAGEAAALLHKKGGRTEASKRWLPVLMALVSLLVAITSYLQADASARASQLNRRAQEDAIASTGLRTRGQQQVAFGEYVTAREYDELSSDASRLASRGDTLSARAYITASREITGLSPLMGPAYTTVDREGLRTSQISRYEVDTWVVTTTLLSERREATATEANEWDGKGNNYVAAIAILAVTLFLFGLCSNLAGMVRWMFLLVGLGLTGMAMLWVAVTAIVPVHRIPDAALQQYAEGYGHYWQGQYEDAIQHYTLALAQDSQYANAYNARGFSELNLRPPRLDAAIKDLLEARRQKPDDYEVGWNLGWAYYLAGDYAKSIPLSQEALALNPKVCGPAFNVALARLASGTLPEAEKAYDAAIAQCESIYKSAVAAGLGPPSSLWRDMSFSADDLDNLLCQTHQKYCYPNRDKPDVTRIANRDALLPVAEKYRTRIREAVTALEYLGTTTVTPSGAKFTPLHFANQVYGEDDKFKSYAERSTFPYDPPSIYALWAYSAMTSRMNIVWKVFLDGAEETGLRYIEDWGLKTEGTAEKKINSWYLLSPGQYTVQVYANGELVSSGEFAIDENVKLTTPPLATVQPSGGVAAGALVLGDDFAGNNNGWWTGASADATVGTLGDGKYTLVTHRQDDFWRVTCLDCASLDNFYYEVNTQYRSGPTDWGYGLVFRADVQMHNLYLFSIDANGQYTIGKVVDGKYVSPALSPWTASSAIVKNGANRLGVAARGNTLEFYINGQMVKRLTDNSISKGRIGLSVERNDLEVSFSQLRVWQLR